MLSPVLVSAVAIMIASASNLYAQQNEGGARSGQSPALSNEDCSQSVDARIACRLLSLKERLRLTPEQESNWPAYEAAFQAFAKDRRKVMDPGQERPSDPAQRMRQRAESLGLMGAALSRLAAAEEPLYNSLDQDQKRQFARLSPMLTDRSEAGPRFNNGEDRSSRDRDNGDRRAFRYRDDGDQRPSRDRDRSSWRGRDDDDRPGWRDRTDGERGGWRRDWNDEDRGVRRDGEGGDRRAWHDRDDDGRRARDDREDGYRSSWRDRDGADRRGSRDRDGGYVRGCE